LPDHSATTLLVPGTELTECKANQTTPEIDLRPWRSSDYSIPGRNKYLAALLFEPSMIFPLDLLSHSREG